MLEKLGFLFLPMFAMCMIAVPTVMMWLEGRDAKKAALEKKTAEAAERVAEARRNRHRRRN